MATATPPTVSDPTSISVKKCVDCDEAFSTHIELNNHKYTHGRYECSSCHKRFKAEARLKEHQQTHPVTFKAQASSLADISEAKLFTKLAALVGQESAKSVFAVGGSIVINQLKGGEICDSDEAMTDNETIPIKDSAGVELNSIREAPPVSDKTGKMEEPIAKEQKTEEQPTAPAKHVMRCDPDGTQCREPSFEQLLHDCEPASFGRGGESVMDETYRKAGKLYSSTFSSNLNPYTLGITDTTAQALIPKLAQRTNLTSGLRAELYKLNVDRVYSAPSGKFKAHVDTPRSKHQVGSLVICLPCSHDGGQLVVRHQGRERVFDWSGEKGNNNIQWAAFFSDCEHEVLEVTSGHRVTITYNLYFTCKANTAALDPQQVELYTMLKMLLSNPAFCMHGWQYSWLPLCSYLPHTNKLTFATLPATLKGIDKLLYESLSNLGLKVKVRHELDGAASELSSMYDDEDDYYEDDEYEDNSRKGDRKGDKVVLSKGLRPLYLSSEMDYEGDPYDQMACWDPNHTIERVVWLNRAILIQPAIMHGTYGNEPGTALQYANLVVTVTIPPFCER